MRSHNIRTCLLFLTVFFVGLLWVAVVPIWHTPDEQVHFGQIAFMAEKGRNPETRDKYDLTEEILISEKLLGTERNNLGNNKFTFHPEYRIDYTDTYIGKYESSISALAKTEARKNFIKEESSRYPLLYYFPGAVIYKFFYSQDIFTRIFFVRIWSLVLLLATVYITYRLGKLLFHEDSLFSYILAIMVGFQPMMMFANIGVNSDALGNLLFTLFLYLSAKIIIHRLNIKIILLYFLSIILSIYTKPQFIITIPFIMLLFLFIGIEKIRNKKMLLFALTILSVSIYVFLHLLRSGPASIIIIFLNTFNPKSFIKFSLEYTLPHTIKEVLPWYWGIYNWLGVTYPRIVHRIINRIIIISSIGLLFWIIKVIRTGKWKTANVKAILFLSLASVLYFIAISFYDWLSWFKGNYPLGVQGRYFFSVISAQMVILLIGWQTLFSFNNKIKVWGIKLAAVGMIVLNSIGVFTVARSYYDVSSLQNFIIQASQYKPWFVKGNNLLILIVFAIIFTLFGVIIPLLLQKYEYHKQIKDN